MGVSKAHLSISKMAFKTVLLLQLSNVAVTATEETSSFKVDDDISIQKEISFADDISELSDDLLQKPLVGAQSVSTNANTLSISNEISSSPGRLESSVGARTNAKPLSKPPAPGVLTDISSTSSKGFGDIPRDISFHRKDVLGESTNAKSLSKQPGGFLSGNNKALIAGAVAATAAFVFANAQSKKRLRGAAQQKAGLDQRVAALTKQHNN